MQCMDRTVLEGFLSQGLSLAEIGRRVDLHEATVGYWVKKHGLQAVNHRKHVRKGRIPRDELEALVGKGAVDRRDRRGGRSKQGDGAALATKVRTADGNGVGGRSRDGAREAREAGLTEVALTCLVHGPVGQRWSRAATTDAVAVAQRRCSGDAAR